MKNDQEKIVVFVRQDEDDYIALSWCPTPLFPRSWIRGEEDLSGDRLKAIVDFIVREIRASRISADEVLNFLEAENTTNSDRENYRLSQFAQLMPEILDEDEEADLVPGETVETSSRLAAFLNNRNYQIQETITYSEPFLD